MYAADQLEEASGIFTPETEGKYQLVARKVFLQLEEVRLHIFIQPDLDRSGSLIQIRLFDPPEESFLILIDLDPDTLITYLFHGPLQIGIISAGSVIDAADLTEVNDRKLIEFEFLIVWGYLADQIENNLLLLEGQAKRDFWIRSFDLNTL